MNGFVRFVATSILLSYVADVQAQYDWSYYGGNAYALTLEMGDWDACEAEAVAVGGHLVTINDADENAWLTDFIADARTREHPDPSNNIAWIGFHTLDGVNWEWIARVLVGR